MDMAIGLNFKKNQRVTVGETFPFEQRTLGHRFLPRATAGEKSRSFEQLKESHLKSQGTLNVA